ncbi:MAG: DUF3667 domain-containing protein [Flavitalea sp.]
MSHSKERTEKDCLNCGEIVQGRYCQNCGQENIVPKETLWSLISHFFQDITHFDGKFFGTVRLLVRKPGFLPKEYIAGRRASYLHPIRMYVFTSALFFLIFYSQFNVKDWGLLNKKKNENVLDLSEAKDKQLKGAKTKEDSVNIENAFSMISKLPVPVGLAIEKKDTSTWTTRRRDNSFKLFDVEQSFEDAYSSNHEYDSIQASLPADERDGWWNRQVEYRNIKLKQKYGEDNNELYRDLIDKFMHTFPYLLFISLPMYALFLKLLYIRRKQFYYVDHGLFLIYLYIFTFLYLLIYFGLQALENRFDFWLIDLLLFVFMLYGLYYTYKAMRGFYGQSRTKTILKFILLNLMSGTAIILLFVLFFIVP